MSTMETELFFCQTTTLVSPCWPFPFFLRSYIYVHCKYLIFRNFQNAIYLLLIDFIDSFATRTVKGELISFLWLATENLRHGDQQVRVFLFGFPPSSSVPSLIIFKDFHNVVRGIKRDTFPTITQSLLSPCTFVLYILLTIIIAHLLFFFRAGLFPFFLLFAFWYY